MKPRKTSSQLATPPSGQDPSWPFVAANAGMRRRLVAWLLDRLIVVAPLSVVVAAANALDLQRSSAGIALLTAAVMLVNWTYWIYCWSQMSASLGQLLLGLRVDHIGEDRGPTVAEATRRWAALEAPFALLLVVTPGPLWYLAALLVSVWTVGLLATTMDDAWRRGLHDRFAGSHVVRDQVS